MGKSGAIANIIVGLGPLIMALSILFVTVIGAVPSAVLAIIASICGVCLLVIAKLPVWKSGKFVTFGTRGLSPKGRRLYFWAWGFIVLAFMLWFGNLPSLYSHSNF